MFHSESGHKMNCNEAFLDVMILRHQHNAVRKFYVKHANIKQDSMGNIYIYCDTGQRNRYKCSIHHK